MAKIAYLSRQALVTQNNIAVNSGADFGVTNVSGFTRLTGFATGVGSMTVRLRTGAGPTGPFIVSSNWVVNSGYQTMDAPNYGSWVAVDITNTTQTSAGAIAPSVVFQIFGDPVR